MQHTLTLRPLQAADQASFSEGVAEFEAEAAGFHFALGNFSELTFEEYLYLIHQWSLGQCLPARFVANTFLVGVVGDEVVGRVSIRHELNEVLASVGGHIGYMVRPAHRRQGYATEMLRQALERTREFGLTRVLVTCDQSNVGSARVIEKNGGVFEGLVLEHPEITEPKRRYWIDL